MRKTTLSLMMTALLVSGAAAADDRDKRQGAAAKGHAESEAQLSVGSARAMGSATAFAKVDANDDKVVTRREAQAMKGLPQQFGKLDANGDGELTIQEFAALSGNTSGRRGPSAEVAAESNSRVIEDAETRTNPREQNRRGSSAEGVTGAEARVREGTETRTGRPAENRRGAISETEMSSTADLKVEEINRANAVQAFNNMDADGDFKLDQQEAARIQGLDRRFAELDKNGDGTLDYAEFNAITGVEYRER